MIIDISKYQNQIDWQKAKSQIEAVYIKATEGVGYVDPEFRNHVIGANTVNIPIGFYHFASLNSKDVIADSTAEAKSFFNTTRGYKVGLPYVLDIEKNDIGLVPEDVVKWIHNFFLQLHLLGINDVAIYSYTPFLNTNLTINHNLGDIKLWLAQYSTLPTPTIPKGWSKAWLWQWSDKGVVLGITGNVDENKLL